MKYILKYHVLVPIITILKVISLLLDTGLIIIVYGYVSFTLIWMRDQEKWIISIKKNEMI